MTMRPINQGFAASAPENYERFFVPAIGEPVAVDLLHVAGLIPGERVLDVGCGTGILTRKAAEQIGDRGSIVGLDNNPGMLAVARSVTPDNLPIEWQEANAEHLPFPNESFDVVLCQMSLQFVPDRVQGLREMHRVLVPRGRLFLNLPGPTPPLFDALADAMERHIASEAAGFVQHVFSLHDIPEIERLLADARFREIGIQAHDIELSLPPPKEFLWQYVQSTPLSDVVLRADDDAKAALEQEVVTSWQGYEEEGRMDHRQRIVIAGARK